MELPKPKEARLDLWVILALIAGVAMIYAQTISHDFVNYDDQVYLYRNPRVQQGLTGEAIRWAFTTGHTGYSHPLTWLVHMLNFALFGMWAGGHHLVSALLHALASVSLYLALIRMTGAQARSAFVAAMFAFHSLHVESVAWASELKDVLSGLFWILGLWTYALFVHKRQWRWYAGTMGLGVLGLLSKPMMVTFPFALLLLDYWPLRRKEAWWKLVGEKLPLFLAAIGIGALTFYWQKNFGVLVDTGALGIGHRMSNAAIAYATYLLKMISPTGLAVFYPIPAEIPTASLIGSIALLLAITIAVIVAGPWARSLRMGWCWYLGTLVPVIGIIQVGSQSMADRYTYVPLIGIAVMAAWGFPHALAKVRYGRRIAAVLAILSSLVLIGISIVQTSYWRNSVTLFSHALQVTEANDVAHNHVADALMKLGQYEAAIPHFEESLRLRPRQATAEMSLGVALAQLDRHAEAEERYRTALKLRPSDPAIHGNYGVSLLAQGRWTEGIRELEETVRLAPGSAQALQQLNAARIRAREAKESRNEISPD